MMILIPDYLREYDCEFSKYITLGKIKVIDVNKPNSLDNFIIDEDVPKEVIEHYKEFFEYITKAFKKLEVWG